jgi:acyl-CoA thioesterase-2
MSTWNGVDISPLFDLEQVEERLFQSEVYDFNMQRKIYGGQLLAQVGAAAARCVESDRQLASLHGLFLRSAGEGGPIQYAVEILQHGKRYTNLKVRGTQDGRNVIDGQITFQKAQSGPGHHPEPAVQPDFDDCLSMEALDALHAERLSNLGYRLYAKPTLEARFCAPDDLLFQPSPTPHLAYWTRPRAPVAEDDLTQRLLTIYLSDYYLGYIIMGRHIPMVGARDAIYVASLNHTIRFYDAPRPNDGILHQTESHFAGAGRGLAHGRLHNRDGRAMAHVIQECVMSAKAG